MKSASIAIRARTKRSSGRVSSLPRGMHAQVRNALKPPHVRQKKSVRQFQSSRSNGGLLQVSVSVQSEQGLKTRQVSPQVSPAPLSSLTSGVDATSRRQSDAEVEAPCGPVRVVDEDNADGARRFSKVRLVWPQVERAHALAAEREALGSLDGSAERGRVSNYEKEFKKS